MSRPLDIAIFGLSLTSSWGNGHATTFRGLVRGLAGAGHQVRFFERDVPWYAGHRDLPDPDFCELQLYGSLDAVLARNEAALRAADAVIVGSYVPDGVDLVDRLSRMAPRLLCFYDIDTPVTLAKLACGDEEYLARRQIPTFDIYFSFSGGEVLTTLEQTWGARRAEALYCSVDAERYAPTGEPAVWDLGYLGTYSPDRQPALERLLIEPARALPGRRFVVAGPSYPQDTEWPENVELIDHLPPADHAWFYSRQRWTLNVTRADMVAAGWSPSVRLFEAASCGTPIISDRWRGLDELLPDGEAIVVADTTEQAIAAIDRCPEPKRRAIAARARQIISISHTSEARADDLAAKLKSAGASGGGAAALAGR